MKFRPGCSARLAYCLANPYSSHADSQNCNPRVFRRDSRHQLHHMDDSMASAETIGAAAAGNSGRAAARPSGTWEQTAAHLHFHARVLGLGAQEVIETLAGVLLVKDAQGIKCLVWHPSSVLQGEASGHADDHSAQGTASILAPGQLPPSAGNRCYRAARSNSCLQGRPLLLKGSPSCCRASRAHRPAREVLHRHLLQPLLRRRRLRHRWRRGDTSAGKATAVTRTNGALVLGRCAPVAGVWCATRFLLHHLGSGGSKRQATALAQMQPSAMQTGIRKKSLQAGVPVCGTGRPTALYRLGCAQPEPQWVWCGQ